MGVGFLKLNQKYINAKHPDGQWVDEPQNSSLRFQFDPDDVKFSVHTKWEEAEKSNSFMQIPWKYASSGSTDPNTIDLTLHFDDRINAPETSPGTTSNRSGSSGTGPSAAQWSAQRSAEILEAWATPIIQPTVHLLIARYEKEFKWSPIISDWPSGSINLFAMGAGVVTASGDYDLRKNQYSREKFGTQEATIQGTRMGDDWHGPRPLLLALFTIDSIQCVLTALELEIVAIDTGTGSPLAIDAHITLEEWVPADLGNGLYVADDSKQVLEEFKTISSWNKAVMSGKLKETVPPDWTIKVDAKGPVVGERLVPSIRG